MPPVFLPVIFFFFFFWAVVGRRLLKDFPAHRPLPILLFLKKILKITATAEMLLLPGHALVSLVSDHWPSKQRGFLLGKLVLHTGQILSHHAPGGSPYDVPCDVFIQAWPQTCGFQGDKTPSGEFSPIFYYLLLTLASVQKLGNIFRICQNFLLPPTKFQHISGKETHESALLLPSLLSFFSLDWSTASLTGMFNVTAIFPIFQWWRFCLFIF